MNKRIYALFGVFCYLPAYLAIIVAITLSPWFSWKKNALSDLGHSVISEVAPIFNLGILLTGFLTIIYAFKSLKEHAKITSVFLIASAFSLQLIATFDEVYVFIHGPVSVLFFILIEITSLIYSIEKKSLFAFFSFLVGVFTWIIFFMDVFIVGISVPEIISSISVTFILISSAFKIYKQKKYVSTR
jgi:hypothetical membrane protein